MQFWRFHSLTHSRAPPIGWPPCLALEVQRCATHGPCHQRWSRERLPHSYLMEGCKARRLSTRALLSVFASGLWHSQLCNLAKRPRPREVHFPHLWHVGLESTLQDCRRDETEVMYVPCSGKWLALTRCSVNTGHCYCIYSPLPPITEAASQGHCGGLRSAVLIPSE